MEISNISVFVNCVVLYLNFQASFNETSEKYQLYKLHLNNKNMDGYQYELVDSYLNFNEDLVLESDSNKEFGKDLAGPILFGFKI